MGKAVAVVLRHALRVRVRVSVDRISIALDGLEGNVGVWVGGGRRGCGKCFSHFPTFTVFPPLLFLGIGGGSRISVGVGGAGSYL